MQKFYTYLKPIKNGVFPEVPKGVENATAIVEGSERDGIHYAHIYENGKWSVPIPFCSTYPTDFGSSSVKEKKKKKKITKYRVIHDFQKDYCPTRFDDQINALLADGWELRGKTTNRDSWHHQVMVFKE
jgi:hypothetical protein